MRESLLSDHPEDGKVKLISGSKIYTNKTELKLLKMQYRSKPEQFARRLIKSIVGEDELESMTPDGDELIAYLCQFTMPFLVIYVNKKIPPDVNRMLESRYQHVLQLKK
ncbi:hypothetical protein TSAR_007247 [Trichomalopsis sarcophagae]|uniref:Uncharacterized protein n=1 Tax=Trichomalopsis sarcophagae TaxID=543379 RepID=A0A232EWA6_9HYME|nr:hypothetical protein TSAR_007247 [Trichomalopsis sarcophagae]